MSLNQATADDVADLPGIGMAFAGTLIGSRPPTGYRSWDEVAEVKGVGPARLRLLQERFTVP